MTFWTNLHLNTDAAFLDGGRGARGWQQDTVAGVFRRPFGLSIRAHGIVPRAFQVGF